jgi:hypothetical protein
LVSVGAAASASFVSAAGAALVSGAAVSASDEVQRVYKNRLVSKCVKWRPRIIIYQVVSQELHDEGRVLVALLAEGVKFCGLDVRFM